MPGLAATPFGPWWFATDARVSALPAADVGGLALLLSHWWTSGDLPADDESLAALSRLGVSWGTSRLRACLSRFFETIGGVLRSLDLAPVREADRAVREKRRQAGLASGAARRRTPVEHPLNTCSTPVQRVFNKSSNEGVKSNDDTGLSGPGSRSGVPGPLAADVPPHTPLIERVSSCNLPLEGGGRGGQLDLFAETPPPSAPRKVPRRAASPARFLEAATSVVDHYVATVQSAYRRTAAADRNCAHWLARGHTVESLKAAVGHYSDYCDRVGRSSEFRKSPHKFFGIKDPEFLEFMKEKKIDVRHQPQSHVGGSARIRDERNDYDALVVRVRSDDVPAAPGVPAARAPADEGRAVDPGNPFLRA